MFAFVLMTELLLKVPLKRTWRFYSSGLVLDTDVDPSTLQYQVPLMTNILQCGDQQYIVL